VQALIRSPRSGWLFTLMALAGVGIFAFAVGVLMLPHSIVLGERLPELTCLQVAFTTIHASAVIMSFTTEQQVAIASLLVPGDMVFAWGYGLVLAGLVGLLARRFDGGWLRAGAVVMWIPLIASMLDVIEDVFLYSIVGLLLENPSTIVAAELPMLAGIAAVLKYFALVIVTPAYSVAGILHGLRVDRRAGALLVYFLLLVVCISMIVRPLQQLSGCFWLISFAPTRF